MASQSHHSIMFMSSGGIGGSIGSIHDWISGSASCVLDIVWPLPKRLNALRCWYVNFIENPSLLGVSY